MKIRSLHGYFLIDEREPGDASQFASIFGLGLVADGRSFTFAALADAPRHAIAGGTYLGAPATKTFEGEPWEVMRENNLVYSIDLKKVVPIAAITSQAKIDLAGNYFISRGIIQPGSVKDDGSRVKDYAAYYLFGSARFKYSEVSYE